MTEVEIEEMLAAIERDAGIINLMGNVASLKLLKMAIDRNPHVINEIPNPNMELSLYAVMRKPSSIILLEQTRRLVGIALSIDGDAIRHVHNPTIEQYKLAARNYPDSDACIVRKWQFLDANPQIPFITKQRTRFGFANIEFINEEDEIQYDLWR